MKYSRADTRGFNKKQKRLCNVCKRQLTHKEIDVHKECKYDDLVSAFIGRQHKI